MTPTMGKFENQQPSDNDAKQKESARKSGALRAKRESRTSRTPESSGVSGIANEREAEKKISSVRMPFRTPHDLTSNQNFLSLLVFISGSA